MGPRPEDRGEPPPSVPPTTGTPPFNGATARRPWRTSAGLALFCPQLRLHWGHGPKTVENLALLAALTPHVSKLQWGHGPKTVENPAKNAPFLHLAAASMGPRPEDRGERQ